MVVVGAVVTAMAVVVGVLCAGVVVVVGVVGVALILPLLQRLSTSTDHHCCYSTSRGSSRVRSSSRTGAVVDRSNGGTSRSSGSSV